jgi:hypothetical protein
VGAHVHGARLYTFLAAPERGITISDTHELTGRLEDDAAIARDAAAAARIATRDR